MHGYLADNRIFFNQYKSLKNYFEIYAPDLKGFGTNRGMTRPYSLDDYADEVKEYVMENGLKNPHVIAHSFGGRIAIKLASENPDLFDKIVLTGSAGLKPRFSIKKQSKKIIFKTLKPFLKKEKLECFYSSDYRALSPIMKESFIKIVGEHLDDRISKIQNQVLIVNGKLDKETPVYTAKKLNKGIKNSKLVLIENAGHFCFMDKPIKFNTEVVEFLLS